MNPDSPAPAGTTRRRGSLYLGVAASVALFAVLAAFHAYVIPVYEPPDEASHVGYMLEVSKGRLPTIDTEIPLDAFSLQQLLQRDDAHQDIWVANHPPLFYWLTALPAKAGAGTMPLLSGIRLVRLIPIVFGMLSILLIAVLATKLVPGRPQIAVAAAALSAATPAFTHFSAILYNDSLGVLTTTATLVIAVDVIRKGPSWRRIALLAAVAALAALTRSAGLATVGLAMLAVVAGTIVAGGEGVTSRRLLRGAALAGVVGLVAVAASGWFYLRNVRLYGDLTGAQALFDKFARVPGEDPLSLLTSPGVWGLQAQRLVDYSYFNLSALHKLEDSETVWSRLLLVVPVAGMAVILLRRARHRLIPSLLGPKLLAWALCLLFLAALEWSVISFASGGGNVHGRYLFPALGILSTGAALGLGALPLGRRGVQVVAVLLGLHVLGYMVADTYLEFATEMFPGQSSFEAALRNVAGPPAPLVLGALATAVVGLTAVQAVALWRLAPPATGYALLPARRALPAAETTTAEATTAEATADATTTTITTEATPAAEATTADAATPATNGTAAQPGPDEPAVDEPDPGEPRAEPAAARRGGSSPESARSRRR